MSQLFPTITNEDLLGLIKDAKRSCTCDGGGSLCRACSAEATLNHTHQISIAPENLRFIEAQVALAIADDSCSLGKGHAKTCTNADKGHVPAGPESFYRPPQLVYAGSGVPVPFNKLTPKQVELLSKLAEECGETVQRIGKILVHGYESYHPHRPEMEDNRKELEKELADIIFMAMRLCDNNDLDRSRISTRAYSKERMERFLQYTHHQGD